MPRDLDPKGAAGGAGWRLPHTLSRWFLKPAGPGVPARSAPTGRSREELAHEHRHADDKERMVGLIAAPVAAAIGFVVARHAHGTVTSRSEVLLVALALALVMLALAWFRKWTYLGIAMALYGLSVFSLGFWGFGMPFVFAAAWLLVRAYRAQRDLSEAAGTPPPRSGGQGGRHRPAASAPSANRRYTPPAGHGRAAGPR